MTATIAGWVLSALLVGYIFGRAHFYCTRCRHYQSWRATLLREMPSWPMPRSKDPWERDDPRPPKARAAGK